MRSILRHPLIPLEYTEENKALAADNEILIDKDDMLYIKRYDKEKEDYVFLPLWKIAMELLGGWVLRYLGMKETKDDLLAIENPEKGDMWIVKNDESLQTADNKFIEYVYTQQEDGTLVWEQMGGTAMEVRSTIDIREEDPVDPKEGYCWITIPKSE